jgi:hypothetical protein
MELTEFITARLDEDEAAAQAARKLAPSDTELAQQAGPCVSDAGYVHIARHHPNRVLREVAAKRAILARHPPDGDRWPDCATCSCEGALAGSDCIGTVSWPCPTVRDVAAIWSDHPDYRPEWAPLG